ncbi:MAG: hypothetical protein A6D91_11070 [Bacillaceae bacterium G1]|nr:MAG: hypothetical protein A6D91_11070 [Bacillaceae bacterium G1]
MVEKWLKAATIRAIRTAAQAAIGAIGAATVFSEVDWRVVAGTALLATIVSYLTSLAGLPEVQMEDGDNNAQGN